MITQPLKHCTSLIAVALLAITGQLCADQEADHETQEAESLRTELQDYLKNDAEGRQVSAFIQQQFPPEIAAFVQGMLQRDPFVADESIGQLSELYHEYTALLDEVPEEAALFLQIQRHEALSHVLSESFDPESPHAAEIAQKIRAELELAFDLKLQWQQYELGYLEDEVQELKSLLEQRKKAREAIIKRRLDELTGVNSHLEW